MSDEREFQTVVLAALLHDIGKFLQRGKGLPFSIEGTHPEVSFQFVTAFAETFEKVTDLELLKTLVKHHHRSRGYGSGIPSIEDIKESRARLPCQIIGVQSINTAIPGFRNNLIEVGNDVKHK